MLDKSLIVICGPTAIGKTKLAIELAKKYQTEIISADSRQFFKEMNLGTAKPKEEELNAAPHHFINNISVEEDYNVGKYEEEALSLLEKLFLKQATIFMVGGSGLYIDAVCDGFDDIPPANEKIRNAIIEEYEEKGIKFLQDELQNIDADYFEQVDQNNPQRLMRGIEVFRSSGKKYSSIRMGNKKVRPFKIIKIGLDMDREVLYERINVRVDEMIDAGLEEEARTLIPFKNKNALQTVGYKEFFDFFEGKLSLEECISLIRQNTRRYAKRQLTWFKKDAAITWFDAEDKNGIIEYLERTIKK